MAMFTTIAAGIGLAATAGTTAMSFAKAGQMRKDMDAANNAATEAMKLAREKLQVNVYDKLAIQKEPYELQIEGMLSRAKESTTQAIEADPRNLSATAGRVQMAFNEGSDAIRTAMGQDLQQLEMLSAQEDARNRDIGVQLDLEEVAGAQLAAANAQELAAQATSQGMEGVTSLGSQLAEKAPLFEKSASARQVGKMDRFGKREGLDSADVQAKVAGLGIVKGVDFSKVGGMNREDYLEFMEGQDATLLEDISKNKLGLLNRYDQGRKDAFLKKIQQGTYNPFAITR